MKNREWKRPVFPKRAVITAGMPYGNKSLHFGHVGGVFVYADVFTRFMRNRIGEDNVVFVSGTDCYGSAILTTYNTLKEQEGFTQSIEEYVEANHQDQKEVLEKYGISLDLYAGSSVGRAGEIHQEVSNTIFNLLYEKGYLKELTSPQFYDEERGMLLNGRQVVGQCPIDGCTSDKAYADECALGHQYMPSELLEPKSILTGKRPKLVEVSNWYFDLQKYNDLLKKWVAYLKQKKIARPYVLNTIEEFLRPPMLYVKRSYMEDLEDKDQVLPNHVVIDEPKKPSVTLVFESLEDRDRARELFDQRGVRFRAGKTLVPFRLSGNVEWGLKVPEKEGINDLTFWVWPESLWAPISFTKAYLESVGASDEAWKKWWLDKESGVYQFIGEDNIYFYGVAEMGIWLSLLGIEEDSEPDFDNLLLPHIIANRHILFMDKKASSSASVKPPMARELLEHYTVEQLRLNFLTLGLSKKSASFSPQAFMAEEDRVGKDVVVQCGNLLTNVFNRLVRSSLYTIQSHFDGKLPEGEVSPQVLEEGKKAILMYEKHMYTQEFHRVVEVLDTYIRKLSKFWSKNMQGDDLGQNEQALIDALYGIRVSMTLLHPIAPEGCEKVREYLNIDEKVYAWDTIFEPINSFMEDRATHTFKYLEPRIDFFEKIYKKQ